ncbi:MAG: DUF4091 domain-containing protein [Erysipelotrichaceae bacterium]|nr:DUF4091 domain-containing protein [Erysipelotrichaceae bacterium]
MTFFKKMILTLLLLIMGCSTNNDVIEEKIESDTLALFYETGTTNFNNGKDSLDEVVWKNDSVTSLIKVDSSKNDNINIQASNLTNEEYTIDSNNIFIGFMKEVEATNNNDKKDKYLDIITNKNEIIVKENSIAFLKIFIPENTIPGNYSGHIHITKNKEEISLPINITVKDYTLTKESFTYELWQYPYSSYKYYDYNEPFSKEHNEYLEKTLDLYTKTGGDSLTVSIVDEPWGHQTADAYPSMIKWYKNPDNTWYYDYTHFDKWIDLSLNTNSFNKIKAFSILPINNRLGYFDIALDKDQALILEPGSEDYNYIYGMFLSSFIAHLDELDIFDITYIAIDERAFEYIESTINLINQYPNKDGKILKISSYFNYLPKEIAITNQIHDISIGESVIQKNLKDIKPFISNRINNNLSTSMYTCTDQYPNSFTFSNPYESTWTMLYALSFDTNGFVRWALDAFNENSLLNTDNNLYESGDTFLIYPGEDSPYTSIRYEMLEIGLNYVNKFKYLSNILDKAELELLYNLLVEISNSKNIKTNEIIEQVNTFKHLIDEK